MKTRNYLLAFILITSLIMISSFASASVSVNISDNVPVIIAGTGEPAVFNLTITNDGESDSFEIYSLEGLSFEPKTFEAGGGVNNVEIKVYPSEYIIESRKSFNIFTFYLKGETSGTHEDKLRIRITDLKDAFEISVANIWPSDNEANVSIKSSQNITLDNVTIKLSSAFFSAERTLSFEPYGRTEMIIPLDKDKIKKLVVGRYILASELYYNDLKAKAEEIINYLEVSGTSVEKKTSGIIIRKTEIKKTNEGNTPVRGRIEVTKDIISRLFTSFSEDPASSERGAIFVNYAWEKELNPSESIVVSITTNYTLPFILIVLIIVVVIFARMATRTNLMLRKRVSFVRTKGGEFALKVRISAKAIKDIKNVRIVDRIPNGTKIYEKFEKAPDRIDESAGKLFWNIDRLNKGEERVYSYIIYSKLKIVGRFELPKATAMYEIDGKNEMVSSNTALFVSEITHIGE